jgi:hypothetical protein
MQGPISRCLALAISATILIMGNHASAGQLTFEKAKKYFGDKKACVLAIAQVYSSSHSSAGVEMQRKLTRSNEGDVITATGQPDGNADIFCVWFANVDEGTVNGLSGCAVGIYNPAFDSYRPLLKLDAKYFVAEGKKCNRESVIQLLKSEAAVRQLKESPDGKYFKGHFGDYRNFFEVYLRSAGITGGGRLRVVYDELGVKDSLCSTAPCEFLDLKKELANIKPSPAEAEQERKTQAERDRSARAEAAREIAEKKKEEAEKKNKEDLWK